MTMLRHIVPLSLMLLCTTGYAIAADGEMIGSDIKARIIGNTVVGVDEGKPYGEYYNPNGTVSGVDSDEYTGSWRIDGNKLCTGFESEDEKKPGTEWVCSGVVLSGDQVTWVDGDGDRTQVKMLRGRQLPKPTPSDDSEQPDQ